MTSPPTAASDAPIRLHLGGIEPREGWSIVNIQPGPGVDHVGDCVDLSRFADGSVAEVYASHVYEHLGYMHDLPRALSEAYRVLKRDGVLRVAVPDLDTLCRLFLQPGLSLEDRMFVQRMMFGGQIDPDDFHKVGLNFELLKAMLERTGFRYVRRVESFGLFKDTSAMRFLKRPISLNVQAIK
jgi:predicted SAM-dependent methyltransferase